MSVKKFAIIIIEAKPQSGILGLDWEVVRISTQYLEQNAELLVEAIKTIKAEKQKLRKENYGRLPEWFSKRERAKHPKKTIIGDDFLSD